MEMSKITACKQGEDETVQSYLSRLMKVAMGINHVISPWEAHLRDRFINGMRPDISHMVKRTCITWEDGHVETIEKHAIHAEKFRKEKKKRKSMQITDRLQMAQLMVYESQARG